MFQSGVPDWEGLDRNREKPAGRPIMHQTWHDLLFLHAKVPRELLQAMVPPELTVEEYGGSAWLGFVPFRMSGIRPRGFPPLPWLSSFHETNIRTYVTHPKYGPGVCFFSLDAARYLGCLIARKSFKLPYFHSRLSIKTDRRELHFRGRRNATQVLPQVGAQASNLVSYSITATNEGMWHKAKPKKFEYWLLERYRLYSVGANGEIVTARVYHEPYKVQGATVHEIAIDGLEGQFGKLQFTNALFVERVNVQCFSPQVVS